MNGIWGAVAMVVVTTTNAVVVVIIVSVCCSYSIIEISINIKRSRHAFHFSTVQALI